MAEYLKTEIARRLNKPPRTIEYWTSSGLVIPDIQPSEGKGKARVFSGRNLIEFAMVELLARLNVSLDTVRHVLAVLRTGKWVPPYKYCTAFEDRNLIHEEKINELNKWTQENTVRFETFWKTHEWGVSKELVFVTKKMIDLQGNLVDHEWFYLVYKEDDRFHFNEVFDAVMASTGGVQTIIWLGEIKDRAVKMILE